MKTVRTYKNQAKLHQSDMFCIWGNLQINASEIMKIVQSCDWSKLKLMKGFYAGVYENNYEKFLFCDDFGLYPLYYCVYGDSLFASQSMHDLLSTIPLVPIPSKEGLLSLLLFGHHIADETLFQEIKRCEGGMIVRFCKNTSRISKIMWRSHHIYRYDRECSTNEDLENLAETFVSGVESAVAGKDNIIIPLSGGFDSRAVLGAALECTEAKRICTITFGGKDTLDFQIGRMISRKVGIESITFPITETIFGEHFQKERAVVYGYGYSPFATQPQKMIDFLIREASRGHPSVWGIGGDAITGSHLHPSDIKTKPCKSLEELAWLLINKRACVPLADVAGLLGFDENEVINIIVNTIKHLSLDKYEKPWQFLDAWDIYVRGRMEMISVIPFISQSWFCPHLTRNYFDLMAGLTFSEKINQKCYRRMLMSRYKLLFSFPTKRLNGRPLVSSMARDLRWVSHWKALNFISRLRRLARNKHESIYRNYGRDSSFIRSNRGQRRLRNSIELLTQYGIVHPKPDLVFTLACKNIQIARMLITVRYAFENKFPRL